MGVRLERIKTKDDSAKCTDATFDSSPGLRVIAPPPFLVPPRPVLPTWVG
jgi:hypothetical protein